MSLRMIELFKGIQASPTQRLVAYMLADSYNEHTQRCDPSYARLIDLTSLSKRAVAMAISALQHAGHLTVHSTDGKRHRYRLHPRPKPVTSTASETPDLWSRLPPEAPAPPPKPKPRSKPAPPAMQQLLPLTSTLPSPVTLARAMRLSQPSPAASPPPSPPHPIIKESPHSPNILSIQRATRRELRDYAKARGFPASDGEALFDYWTANGWRNGKAPCRDWRAGFRSWQHHGWLPSQKKPARHTTRTPTPRFLAYDARTVTQGKSLRQIKQF